MARYSKKSASAGKSAEEARLIARGIQKPGQTKEQTRLVAQGIQKGIELYKKQQAAKKRELDRNIKKSASLMSSRDASAEAVAEVSSLRHKLAWILLLFSWGGFGLYFVLA